MTWLILYLFLALSVSFFCSILEAVILSVSPIYVEALEQKSPETGAVLRRLKTNIDRPLAGILSLNTIAHTVGAAGVGAQSLMVFGNSYVALTSAVLTFLILVLSEIIPKTLGAIYWKRLTPFAVRVLPVLIIALYPLVILSRKIAEWMSPRKKASVVSREELQAMTDLARKKGLFSRRESRILKNLIWVGKLKVKDVMTPRPVIFSLPTTLTVGEVMKTYPTLRFSRIPICEMGPEDIQSFVLKSDIMLEASRGRPDVALGALRRPIKIVPEGMTLVMIFEEFLAEHEHIAMVVSEYGGIEGSVTREDVVEPL